MSSRPDRTPHPWRRYLRFSVRGLIVVVLVVGAGLGWIVHQAHVQRDAVAAIKKAGGSVYYDWEWRIGKPIPGGRPWAPSWLVDLIGPDYFGHVTHVTLRGPPGPTDATLAHVGRLTRLQALLDDSSSASDTGLVHLKGLTKLSDLWLNDTQVTDAGLLHLKGMTNLSSLSLDGTQVTDAGLVHLKGLTNLSDLWLNNTQITDAGLVHLKGMTNLTTLVLSGTRITNEGLADLMRLTTLSQLYLADTQVTDAGMNELKRALPGLTIHR
jgi:hypothetical protein